jgi:uncharacterized protein YdbL (DUF1318 family)
MKKLLTALTTLGLVLMLQTAWAIDLDSAKSQGLVGEANTGYLAAVKTPASAEVRALIQEVNAKRRAEFERTASNTGATLEQVALRFYELAVQRTAPGNYYQDPSGRWQKK